MKKVIYSSLVVFLMLSCVKDPVDVSIGSPVFKIQGTIDGVNVDINAGVNGYMESYHDTLFNKSYLGCSFISETKTTPIDLDLSLDGLLNDLIIFYKHLLNQEFLSNEH